MANRNGQIFGGLVAVIIVVSFLYGGIRRFQLENHSQVSVAATQPKTPAQERKLKLSVRRTSRLGNTMYMYSSLYGLANMTNRTAILSRDFMDLAKIFTLSVPINDNVKVFSHFQRLKEFDKNKTYRVEETVKKLINIKTDVLLEGYFQYVKFFNHVSAELRKEFTFRKEISHQVSVFFNQLNLTDPNVVKVGIHVRRTDLSTADWIKKGFGPPSVAYFTNAMRYFRKKYKRVHFLLCSDDIQWARKHIIGEDITFVTGNPAEIDLAILASCDHVIISNGTYSWWAGWLCKGTTVRYKGIPKRKTFLYTRVSGEYWPPEDAYNHYIAIGD